VPSPTSYPNGVVEFNPRVHMFDIGQRPIRSEVVAEKNRVVVLKRELNPSGDAVFNKLIYGLLKNLGTADFTFSVEHSNDNGVVDTYVGVNIRVKGASVASVVVIPNAFQEFLIEVPTKRYIRLMADPQNTSTGRIVLSHYWGALERRNAEGVP